MKKALLAFALFCFATFAVAQSSALARIDSGEIIGAKYRIFFPENWNKKLVMYAHGYQPPGSPAQSANLQLADSMKPFWSRGFAVAASDYRKTGWALPEGTNDTEALRAFFFKKYGMPDSTFITGHSMGGGITLTTMEYLGANYQGGLPLCPLSSRPHLQVRTALDINATFNVFFPGILPKMQQYATGTAPLISEGGFPGMMKKAEEIREIMRKDSLTADRLARRFEMRWEDLAWVVLFNDGVLRDVTAQAGGFPFDNRNTLYGGFPDDEKVNREVERIGAAPKADDYFDAYDRTGVLDRPVLLLFTQYDPLITPTMGVVNYDNLVHQQDREQWLTMRYTPGQGHCQFSPEETGKAFDLLREWVRTGKKTEAGKL